MRAMPLGRFCGPLQTPMRVRLDLNQTAYWIHPSLPGRGFRPSLRRSGVPNRSRDALEARCSLIRSRGRDTETFLPELLADPLPIASHLDMRGIGTRHGTRKTERPADATDQLEQRGGIADAISVLIGDPEIGGLAVAPASRFAGPAVPGLTPFGSESGGDALAEIVAKG